MKKTCPYCGNIYEQSEEKCPHCDAPNEQRSAEKSGPPKTIEELQRWYELRKLPPYETTRFFIGIDTKAPRAFGIYREGKKVVVYKNKDNGQRAVRYSGTDEAYAVNELYTKLKDEILRQKENNAIHRGSMPAGSAVSPTSKQGNSSVASPKSRRVPSASGKEPLITRERRRFRFPKYGGKLGCLVRLFLFPFRASLVLLAAALIWALGDELFVNPPQAGSYSYESTEYAFATHPDDVFYRDWFRLDGDWEGPLEKDEVPGALRRKHSAKNYLTSAGFSDDGESDSLVSSKAYEDWLVAYSDKKSGNKVDTGYYDYNGNTYYHLQNDADSGWYSYTDDGWSSVSTVPEELLHSYYAQSYYSGGVYDDDVYYTDFADTDYYSDYNGRFDSSGTSSSWSSSSSSSSSWDSDWDWDDDDDWDWDDDDDWDWDSGSSDWDSDW